MTNFCVALADMACSRRDTDSAVLIHSSSPRLAVQATVSSGTRVS